MTTSAGTVVDGQDETSGVVDHLFRQEGAAMVAHLVRWLGPRHLELVEEAVQDAMLQAMRTWPHGGVPANPAGWLNRVARNRAVDLIRKGNHDLPASPSRERLLEDRPADRSAQHRDGDLAFDPDEAPGEDRLRLLLLCCHPALSRTAQVSLALKLCAGFGVREIARAFREQVATTQQRLVRARHRLAGEQLDLDLPVSELASRIDGVRAILLAIHNEGYLATDGELTRDDLAAEAIRLTSLLGGHPVGDQPATHALLAMMLLQTARRPARVSTTNGLIELERQDRSLWDLPLLRLGYVHLERAATGDSLSMYHLLAEIAALHASPNGTEPNWNRILTCYEMLLGQRPSPVLALNRVVALLHVAGVATARRALEALRGEPLLERYHLFHATDADLHRRAGQVELAEAAYRRAESLTQNDAERNFLASRRSRLSHRSGATGADTEPSSAGDPSLVT